MCAVCMSHDKRARAYHAFCFALASHTIRTGHLREQKQTSDTDTEDEDDAYSNGGHLQALAPGMPESRTLGVIVCVLAVFQIRENATAAAAAGTSAAAVAAANSAAIIVTTASAVWCFCCCWRKQAAAKNITTNFSTHAREYVQDLKTSQHARFSY